MKLFGYNKFTSLSLSRLVSDEGLFVGKTSRLNRGFEFDSKPQIVDLHFAVSYEVLVKTTIQCVFLEKKIHSKVTALMVRFERESYFIIFVFLDSREWNNGFFNR